MTAARRLAACAGRTVTWKLARDCRGEVVLVAPVTVTRANVAGASLPPLAMRTMPSISGASAARARDRRRAFDARRPARVIVVPTRRASRAALIFACTAMKRARRSSLTSSGTGSGSALARGAVDRRIGEAADAVELRCLEEGEQLVELALGLAREADDERAADRRGPGRAARHASMRAQRALGVRRALHELQDARARVLERHVEIGQEPPRAGSSAISGIDVVDVRIRIDVVQAHPRAVRAAERVERRRELGHPRLQRAAPARSRCGT